MKPTAIFVLLVCFLNAAQAQLSIQPGSHWKSEGNVFTVLHDLGFRNAGFGSQTAGSLKFAGIQSVNIESASPLLFYNLEIAKSGMAQKVSLMQSASVSNEVKFSQGLLDLNQQKLDLGSAGRLVGENESGRITGENGGVVESTVMANAPNALNPGNLGAMISSPQNLGLLTVRRGHQMQSGVAGNNSILRYYDILPQQNANLNATLRFQYLHAELNTLPENNLFLYTTSNNSTWALQGFTTRDVAANYVEKTGISNFSRWTLSTLGSSIALPVSGLLFAGRWSNNRAELSWQTGSEYRNSHFEVERKYGNEAQFSFVRKEASPNLNGTSTSATQYQWNDLASSNRGPIHYRLKQVDLDGKFSYSNTVVLQPHVSHVFIENMYPTKAVKEQVYIQAGNLNLEQMEVRLYDLSGRLCLNKKLTYASQWLALPSLAPGMYRLQVTSAAWHYGVSFVKQ